MKQFDWDSVKNVKLVKERGGSFEEVVFYIQKGDLLDIVEHPNKEKYKNQKIFVIRINDYAYLVPFVETKDRVFLKTIIPNRKATQRYLSKGDE